MDIQSMLAGNQPGMGGPAGAGASGQADMLPFLLFILQQILGQNGSMPQRPQPQGSQGMPFASALGAAPGGPQMPPSMPPGLPM